MIPSDPAERHRVVAARFAEVAGAVVDWDAPSPVEAWTARDVVDHLVSWFPGFLAGGGVHLERGPEVEDGPTSAWDFHLAAVQALLDGPRAEATFTHPRAETHRLADAIDRFYTSDVFMHTWDLATAAGLPADLDPAECDRLRAGMEPIEELLRTSGQYGPRVTVSEDADAQDRLIGFLGRNPWWPATGLGARRI